MTGDEMAAAFEDRLRRVLEEVGDGGEPGWGPPGEDVFDMLCVMLVTAHVVMRQCAARSRLMRDTMTVSSYTAAAHRDAEKFYDNQADQMRATAEMALCHHGALLDRHKYLGRPADAT